MMQETKGKENFGDDRTLMYTMQNLSAFLP